jgi:aminoglycoside phosphotransferase (APT) family kinase protein
MPVVDAEVIHDQLVTLLQQIFGYKAELVRKIITKQQHDYQVLIIWLRHPSKKLVVKLAGPEAVMASRFDCTAMLHRLVGSNTSIPMPEILAVDVSCRAFPWRYMIRTDLPGREWWAIQQHLTPEELAVAHRQIGAAVAQLHGIHFPAFGELATNGSVLAGRSFLDAFKRRAQKSIRSPRLLEIFLSLVEQHQQLFLDITPACLCHEDLHAYNILFHRRHGQWRLATLLDFEKAWAGHQEIDLARMEFWRGVIGQEFWPVYQSVIPVDPRYELRRPIYQLLWCFEYAQSTPQHLKDTQELCTRLGLPLTVRFD